MSADKQQASSEYLKRTCLICGCHTNQTINIYEPRSGPNIVQLIQAKFKFQPLNEDKYLCFSCNNWLINWHSLQAVNSNDAESPSHMNSSSNNMVHDKANAPLSGTPQQQQKQRPVATVRPRQVRVQHVEPTLAVVNTTSPNAETTTSQQLTLPYGKRRFRRGQQLRRCVNEHKMLRQCSVCGCAIVLRLAANPSVSLNLAKLKRNKYAQCRKCREISNWRALHMKSLATWTQRSLASGSKVLPTPAPSSNTNNTGSSSSDVGSSISSTDNQSNQFNSTNQRFARPRVDGKVVAMFRRLGTTLSREAPEQMHSGATATAAASLPPIMSPPKERPRWSRKLDDDEILLEFDTAISEVLPTSTSVATIDCARDNSKVVVRRKLSYPITNNGNNTDDIGQTQASLNAADLQDLRLPQGLSISLI